MSYYSFFSYTRADYSPYMQQFFADLETDLAGRITPEAGETLSFFDQKEIERGDDWEERLRDALQTSKVMVPLYTPRYFNSPDCGKEWWVFQKRRDEYVRASQGAGGERTKAPPIIKPVIWIPFNQQTAVPPDIDRAITSTQYFDGSPLDLFNQDGLNHILKKFGNRHPAYVDYVRNLALEILNAAREHNVAAVAGLPSWDDIPSAFHPQNLDPSRQQNIISPNHVRFIFVAADPATFGANRSPDPYRERGRGDWKPFPPYKNENRIFRIVQQIVLDEPLGFTSDEIPFENQLNLKAEVEKAWSQGQLVILLVDGWTINWNPQFRQKLSDFDHSDVGGHFYYNCTVLVPWNEQDKDIEARRAEIEATIQDTFQFRKNILKNPIYYRDSIRTKEELRDALRDILTLIKAEIRGKVKVTRPLPAGSTNPSFSGPGA